MKFIDKLHAIERIDGLIRRKATGTPENLANLLGVSRRTVYEIIELMKEMNAPIEYSTIKRTYYYTTECNLTIGFISSRKVNGGKNNFLKDFFVCEDFLHNYNLYLL